MRFSTRSTNPTGLPVGARRSDARSDPVLGDPAGAIVEEEEEFAKPTSLAPKVLVLQVQPVDLTGQPLVLARG